MKLDNIETGPIRHSELSADLVDRIKKYRAILAEVDPPAPLEEVINDFRRDVHPEREIAIWEKLAAFYQAAVSQNPAMRLKKKRKLFERLLHESLNEDPITLDSLPLPD